MGCNCGKQRIAAVKVTAAARKFEFTDRSGSKQTFGSRLEAEAARARAGGGSVRPV